MSRSQRWWWGVLPSLCAASASAATLTHAGHLLDGSDRPVEGSVDLQIALHDAPVGGTALWQTSQPCPVTVRAGRYAVELGAECGPGLPTSALPGPAPRYLALTVNGMALSPRVTLGVVPVGVAPDSALLGGKSAQQLSDEFLARVMAETESRYLQRSSTTLQPGGLLLTGTIEAAQFSGSGVGLTGVPATSLTGTLPAGVLPTSVVTTGASPTFGTVSATSFSGSGAGLTGVPASAVSGVLPDAAIPSTIQRVGAAGGVVVGASSASCGNGSGGGTLRWTGTLLEFCNGYSWSVLAGALGIQQNPARSCKAIKDSNVASADGVYWIDPDQTGPIAAFQAYCDMTRDGGGWMLCANFVDTTGNEVSSSGGYFDFSGGWTKWNGTVPGTVQALNTSGTVNCETMRATGVFTQMRVECTTAANSASNSTPNWSSGALSLPVSLIDGATSGTYKIQTHGEWGWGGYSRGSWVFHDGTYPACGGNSCGFDGTRWADVKLEIAGGYDSPGCAGGCNGNVRDYTGAEEGGRCGGVDTTGVAGERYSFFVR